MRCPDFAVARGPRRSRLPIIKRVRVLIVIAGLLAFGLPAESQGPPSLCRLSASCIPGRPVASISGQPAQSNQVSSGSITGTLSSEEGNPIAGAQVTLTSGNPPVRQEATSHDDGTFSFINVTPGPFDLTITASPFETQTYAGFLAAGRSYVVPRITLVLPSVMTSLIVRPPDVEAEHEVKIEEQQRVLGFIPNFYVTYASNPVPLNFKQKLDLAWKSTTDPVVTAGVAAFAGVEQGKDWFSAYGQGAQGYAKRFGTAYGDVLIGTYLDSAIFPALLKQDPRYYYKGTGGWKSRMEYALTRSVVIKGDNGHWQPNYSTLLGNLATGAIAYPYRTPKDQTVGFIFETMGIRFGEEALGNVFEEFFSRKLTPFFSRHHDDARGGSELANSRHLAQPPD